MFNWRDLEHPWAGGAEVFLYEVARRWVAQGHAVTWLCGNYDHMAERACLEGIEVQRRGGIYSVYPSSAFSYLTQSRGRYDVILDSANGIPFFTPLYSRLPRVLMVHHIHRDVFFHEMPRHLALIGSWMESKWMPELYHRDSVVTVSESSRAALVDLGVVPQRISVIYNGVDHQVYHPGEKSPTPMIAYIGRLRNYKSVHLIVQAMPELLRYIPHLELVIAGSGEALPMLKQMTAETGLSQHIHFCGYVSQEEKVRIMQQAHLVINPSMKEGWGITVIEANACGTVVVGSDVCGLRDSIINGKTGLLFPYGDTRCLVDCIRHLLSHDSERERLRNNALAWSDRFNWDQTARACLDVLTQAVERKEQA